MYSKISDFANETKYSRNCTKSKNEKIGICIAKNRILQISANSRIHENGQNLEL